VPAVTATDEPGSLLSYKMTVLLGSCAAGAFDVTTRGAVAVTASVDGVALGALVACAGLANGLQNPVDAVPLSGNQTGMIYTPGSGSHGIGIVAAATGVNAVGAAIVGAATPVLTTGAASSAPSNAVGLQYSGMI
jgi:hypothetical protein